MAKILKCDDCGSIIQVLAEGDEKVCSDHMLAFPVQTEGEKAPKHKPVVEIDGDKVTVKVGEAAHPMDDDHYIQFVIVEAGNERRQLCLGRTLSVRVTGQCGHLWQARGDNKGE